MVAVADEAPAERVARLEALGVTVLACKSRDGRVDPADLLSRLFAADVTGALLEGGSALNWAFVEAGLVDRVAMFIAPLLIGGGAAPTAVGGRGFLLADALRLRSLAARPLGPDWLLEGDVVRPAGV